MINMSGSKYAGQFEIVLEKKNGNTVISEKRFDGLIKLSPTIHLDSEKVSTYFIVGLGGGYVEGEKYKYIINLKEDSRAIITTQASTKVYKCVHGEKTQQKTVINLKKNSVLEYITDSVILYKDAIYKQINEIHMDESATLIYSDGITSGWCREGVEFPYSSVQLKNNVYIDNKLVLLDNLVVNPREYDVTKLGYFEGYKNFGTLLVINKNINTEVIEQLRNDIKNLNLPICFGISELEANGFVLRVLGDLTQNIESAVQICHNYIRKKFLNSKELSIRKY